MTYENEQLEDIQLNTLQNEFQAARWREAVEHCMSIEAAKANDVDEGFIILFLEQESADLWGIYNVLSIDRGGNVAEFHVNQPYYYPTIGSLLTAAAARTAVS